MKDRNQKSEIRNQIYYTSFPTPIGRIYIAATEKGICRVAWEYKSEKEFTKTLLPPYPPLSPSKGERIKVRGVAIIKNGEKFTGIKNSMIKYFSGKPVSFKCAMDFEGTDFQKRVWRVLSNIPYGKILTYKEVAERIGRPKAARAVGNACGANELPIIIPCHRVIASNRGLGGFSGGIKLKKYLLEIEGIRIK